MAFAVWPVTVNQAALIEGYSEEKEDNRAEQKPAVGPAYHRRRSSISGGTFTFNQILTFDEYDDLEDWYTATLKDGSDFFIRNHPRRTAETIIGKFDERPKSGSPISHNKFLVKMVIRQVL